MPALDSEVDRLRLAAKIVEGKGTLGVNPYSSTFQKYLKSCGMRVPPTKVSGHLSPSHRHPTIVTDRDRV